MARCDPQPRHQDRRRARRVHRCTGGPDIERPASQRRCRAAQLVDLLRHLLGSALQHAAPDRSGQREEPRDEVDAAEPGLRTVGGVAARGGRHHVPDPAAQRRARGGCKNRPDLLGLQASRRAGLQGVLRRQQSRPGDPRRHAVHGHARRTPRRRQCPQRPSPLEREGRRACPRILRQPGAARREGQSDRRRWWRRIRSQGIHRGVRAGNRQGDLALQHGARSRRARLRDLERRRMEDRRRIDLGHGLVPIPR